MNFYRLDNIINYFYSRGWTLFREGKMFLYLKPHKPQKFPKDFLLELPKQDQSEAFNNYIDRIINEFPSLVFNETSITDFKVLFTTGNNVFKCRIYDPENEDGKISLLKHSDSIESIKRALSEAVIFVCSDKQIFGSAKEEVDLYLSQCKALQTEKGSWISNFELPSHDISTLITVFEGKKVSNTLLDVIEFVDNQIVHTKEPVNITENYVSDNRQYLNYELLQSIRDIYKKSNINNIEYHLSATNKTRKVVTEKVLPRIGYFDKYLRQIKTVLLDTLTIEILGKVTNLSSNSPQTSANSDIHLVVNTTGKKEIIKVRLKREEYLEAVEAHVKEKYIKVKGKVRQGKNMLYMRELESFQVVQ